MAQFNALNGQELKSYLLKKVEESLDKSDKFRTNLAYPWFKYSFTLGISCYPQDAVAGVSFDPREGIPSEAVSEPKHLASGSGEEGKVEVEFIPTNITVDVTGIVDTPDKARIETTQPVPTQVAGPGGVQVDKPVVSQAVKFPGKDKVGK